MSQSFSSADLLALSSGDFGFDADVSSENHGFCKQSRHDLHAEVVALLDDCQFSGESEQSAGDKGRRTKNSGLFRPLFSSDTIEGFTHAQFESSKRS